MLINSKKIIGTPKQILNVALTEFDASRQLSNDKEWQGLESPTLRRINLTVAPGEQGLAKAIYDALCENTNVGQLQKKCNGNGSGSNKTVRFEETDDYEKVWRLDPPEEAKKALSEFISDVVKAVPYSATGPALAIRMENLKNWASEIAEGAPFKDTVILGALNLLNDLAKNPNVDVRPFLLRAIELRKTYQVKRSPEIIDLTKELGLSGSSS